MDMICGADHRAILFFSQSLLCRCLPITRTVLFSEYTHTHTLLTKLFHFVADLLLASRKRAFGSMSCVFFLSISLFLSVVSLGCHSACQMIFLITVCVSALCVLSWNLVSTLRKMFCNYENEKESQVFTLWMTSHLKFNEFYVVTRCSLALPKALKLLMIYQNVPLTLLASTTDGDGRHTILSLTPNETQHSKIINECERSQRVKKRLNVL